jgi:hypothetical protein
MGCSANNLRQFRAGLTKLYLQIALSLVAIRPSRFVITHQISHFAQFSQVEHEHAFANA